MIPRDLTPWLLLCLLLVSCTEDPTVQPPLNNPPASPSNPSPAHESTILASRGVRLSWSATDPDGDSLVYDVLIGTDSLVQVADDHQDRSIQYDLEPSTHYQWRVIARDGRGGATTGPVWTFTTGDSLLQAALVAWFPFDGVVADESRSNLISSPTDLTFAADRNARTAHAARFNGSSSRVAVPDAPQLRFGTGSFTVSAWVQAFGAPENFAGIVAKQLDDPSKVIYPGFQLSFRTGGTIEAAIASETERVEAVSSVVVADGAWHMVTMVVDSGTRTLTLYIDGVRAAMSPLISGSTSTGAALFIGHERRGIVFYRGVIDDVAAFNRALTEDEIDRLRRFVHAPG